VYDANFISTWKGKVMKKGMGRMKVEEQETVMMLVTLWYYSVWFDGV